MSGWQYSISSSSDNLTLNWQEIVTALKSVSEPPENISDQQILVNLFFQVREFGKRKFIYPELNRLISPHFLTSHFLPKNLSDTNPDFISNIQSLVDSPDNSIVYESFKNFLIGKTGEIVSILSAKLLSWKNVNIPKQTVPVILPNPSELHQILRLLQIVPTICREEISFPSEYCEILELLLDQYNDSYPRDLVTILGNLLASHWPENARDIVERKPLVRMSIMRGVVAHHSSSSVTKEWTMISFFLQFISSGSGSEIHYAIQSIDMILRKSTATSQQVDIINILSEVAAICLHSWDHQLQMVATVCRELIATICRIGGNENLKFIFQEINKLEKYSKKRFNGLFAISGYLNIYSRELLDDILVSIRTCCPSIAGACQLLTALLDSRSAGERAEIITHISDFICQHHHETDLDQLLMSISRAKKDSSPIIALLKQTILSRPSNPPSPPSLVLKLVQFVLMSVRDKSIEIDEETIKIHSEIVLTRNQVSKFLISCDSSLVASAAVLLLRMPPNPVWQSLLLSPFVTSGSLITLGCSNDDRSIVANELRVYFEKNMKNASYIQSDLFGSLLFEALRPNALQEESQLALEVLVSIEKFRFQDFLVKAKISDFSILESLISGPLNSRWRKIRVLTNEIISKISETHEICKLHFDRILKQQQNLNFEDEFIQCIVSGLSEQERQDFLIQFIGSAGNIEKPNIVHLAALSHFQSISTSGADNLISILSYLSSILILHSQTVGENSFEYLRNRSETSPGLYILLSGYSEKISNTMFRGNVDCRGHPIRENANEISIVAWTTAKAAVNGITNIVLNSNILDSPNHENLVIGIFEMFSSLLLSVKHPALIVPIQSCFEKICRAYPTIAISNILDPLMDSMISGNSSNSFQLPAALRRSQGLGPLVSGIVKSRLNIVFIGIIVENFFSVIDKYRENENSLHAINCLRAIVRDSTIPDRFLEPHIARIMSKSIQVLETLGNEFWRIRSASTQLFVPSARRFIGADNEDDFTANGGLGKSKSRKIVSATEFFYNRKDAEILLNDFKRVLNGGDESIIVSVLSVIQSLSKFGEIMIRDDFELWNLILAQLEDSRSVHVRRLAARVVARASHESGTAKSILNRFEQAELLSTNKMHAFLCLLEILVHLENPHGIEIAQNLTNNIISNKFIGCEIIINSIIRLACNQKVNFEIPFWLLEDGASPMVLQFLATVDTENSQYNQLVSRFCLSDKSVVTHPIYRQLIATLIMTSNDSNVIQTVLPSWLDCSYDYGIAQCLSRLEHVDESVEMWMSSIDVVAEDTHDDVKVTLAESVIFRQKFPKKHAQLLLDESPFVRNAAAVDGMNCVESLEHIVSSRCDETFLETVGHDEYRLCYRRPRTQCPQPSPRLP